MPGTLALTFDDGFREDYEAIYPVLRDRGVPASLAVVPDWIGREGHLTSEQLAALADAGWEVMAHGRKHRYMEAHPLAAGVVAGDDRFLLDSDHVFPDEDHALYPDDTFEVTDGEHTETVTLAGKGTASGDTPYIALEAPLDRGFDAADTVFRPTHEQLRDEIVGVREDFAALGYDPTTFTLPYDAGDARVWDLVAEHYDALADAAVRSLPNPPGTPPHSLRRYYLETSHTRMVEIETYLDSVAEKDGLGVLAGHSAWETVPPERVGAVVDAAHARDIEVTTVRAAVD